MLSVSILRMVGRFTKGAAELESTGQPSYLVVIKWLAVVVAFPVYHLCMFCKLFTPLSGVNAPLNPPPPYSALVSKIPLINLCCC